MALRATAHPPPRWADEGAESVKSRDAKTMAMRTLIVGFDSAWTSTNRGALVAVFDAGDGTFRDIGPPQTANFREAEEFILQWQAELAPTTTIVLLDQPTIVRNASGQRPVENIVGSAVSLRHGGMQPANTGRKEMFGRDAPVWSFLSRFGGAADPLEPQGMGTRVIETYPVLAMIALGWTLPDSRTAGRLPKYNPERKKTFSQSDWQYVCRQTSVAFGVRGLRDIVQWLEASGQNPFPRKSDQDRLDSCLCLLVALYLAEQKDCLMVGNRQTGYIVVASSAGLHAELEARCTRTHRVPSDWVRVFQLPGGTRAVTAALPRTAQQGDTAANRRASI